MIAIRRLLAATAAAVAAVAVLPAPASAAPVLPRYTFTVHDLGVTPAGKFTRLDLQAGGAALDRLTNVKLVIDATAVADFARAWVPTFQAEGDPIPSKDCAVAGAITTCTWAARTAFAGWLPQLKVEAKEGAEVGRSGKLPITFTADGVEALTTTPTITVAEDVDLVAGPVAVRATAKPDALVEAPIEIRNNGTKPVDGVVARFTGETAGLRIAGRYTNCVYRTNGDESWCRFDQELAPGTTYRVGAPVIRTLAEPDGDDDRYSYLHLWFTADDIDEAGAVVFEDGVMTPGTQGELKLEPAPATVAKRHTTDSNGANNLAFGYVTIEKASASPSPAPTVTPTATPTATATPATPGARPGTGGTGGGGLAITGANTAAVVGIGALFLVLGAGALMLGRRRRDA